MAVTFTEHFDTASNGTALTTSNTAFQAINSTSTTLTEDTSNPTLSGGGCMAVTQTALFGTGQGRSAIFTAATTAYARFCVWLAALPVGGSVYIAASFASGTSVGRIAINTAGNFILQNGTSTIATSTTAITTSQWYRLEWDWVGTTATVRIFTSPFAATATETISGTVTSQSLTQFVFGIVASANNPVITVRYDELSTNDSVTPGSVPFPASSAGSFAISGTSLFAASSSGAVGYAGPDTSSVAGRAAAAGSEAFSGTATLGGASASVAGSEVFSGTTSGSMGVGSPAGGVVFSGSSTAATTGNSPGTFTFAGTTAAKGSSAAAGSYGFSGSSAGIVPPTSSAGAYGFSGSSTYSTVNTSANGAYGFAGAATGKGNAPPSNGSLGLSGVSTGKAIGSSAGGITEGGTDAPRGLAAGAGAFSITGGAAQVVRVSSAGSAAFSGATTSFKAVGTSVGGVVFSATAADIVNGPPSRGQVAFGGTSTGVGRATSAGIITYAGKGTSAARSVGSFVFAGNDSGVSNHPLGVLSYPATVRMVDTTALVYQGSSP